MFTDFDKRMKEIEHRVRIVLPPVNYYIIRLDGRAFHTFTKPFKRGHSSDPFSYDLHDAFVYACEKLADEIDGCLAIYTQSDEVSILLKGKQHETMTPWFGGNIMKLTSITSSIFSCYFNDKIESDKFAFFDSRAFHIEDNEVNNYFIWRQQDAIRNSVSMYAQRNFSHKELQGIDVKGQKEMLKNKGLDWDELDEWKKKGTLFLKKNYKKYVSWIDKLGKQQVRHGVVRSKWSEVEPPMFVDNNILDIVDENKI